MRGRRAEAVVEELEGLGGGVNGAFELGVFGGLKHGFELGAGRVAGGDEVAAGDEEGGAGVFLGLGFVLLLREVVEAEVAVAGAAVQPVESEVLIEPRQAEEALKGGLLHLQDVPKAHVVLDQGDDLGFVLVRKAEAIEDGFSDADAYFDVAVEADTVLIVAGVGGAIGGGLADVVKECAPGEGGGGVGRKLLEQEHGVDPDVALGMVLGGLLDAVHPDGLREDLGEQAGYIEEFEGMAGVAFREHPGEFVADALVADLGDVAGLLLDGGKGAWLDLEPQAGGETDRAEHAELVFGEAGDGVADGADDAGGEVGLTVDKVEGGGCSVGVLVIQERIEEHAVDGEVAAEHIFAGVGGEADRVGAAAVGVGAIVAEGGDLDGGAVVATGITASFATDEDDAEVGAYGEGL